MRNRFSHSVRAAGLALTMLVLALPARAQQPTDTAAARRALEQQVGRNVSQAEILERLRQSGMSRSQVRARLQQMGYDPGLADRYFDVLERGGDPPRGDAPQPFLEALSRIGVSTRADDRMRDDRMRMDSLGDPLFGDSLRRMDSWRDSLLADTLRSREPEVFGLRTFRRSGTQFEPLAFGPVDSGYRLGPGDELMLVLTGDVEAAYSLDVTREGQIFVPDVGQISVNGLTLGQLEDVLYARLGRVYSGVSRSASATTRFQVSIGQLRMNQVFVRGEVVMPGAYQVSSAGSLFNALYLAGGPTENGSFRRIEVHRGDRLVREIDLYPFLVGGGIQQDIRLEHGDHVFVPPVGTQVQVEGSVRRPAIFEVRPGEGLREVMVFAGGLRSDAMVSRVQIDRILPPSQQRPGAYRTLVDVTLADIGAMNVDVADGDIVSVFAVPDQRRNRMVVVGGVRNPGLYEWSPSSTLWSAIQRADGLDEAAYTARAHVYRYVESDGSRRLIQASLEQDEAGRPLHDLPLADNDSIVILSREDLRTAEAVAIDGFVKFPDVYTLARGMSLRDLVLAAGGFIEGALVGVAEVTRLPDQDNRSDTTAIVYQVPIGASGVTTDVFHRDMVPHWTPEANEFQLRHGDRVFIRRAPGYEVTRAVTVTGQILVPGTYVLSRRDERFSEVVARAGGLTPQAYRPGMHVVRDGRVIAGDLQRALRDPSDANNVVLMEGDSIHVPALDQTVVVTGAVNFEAGVLFAPGEGLDYYIRQAGGYRDEADRDRVTVSYPNGERAGIERWWVGRRTPRIQPGSRVFVPAKPESRTGPNWDQIITRTAALLSATATIFIAAQQLR
jgi:polysaccharide biosynthesis/export protein